MVEAVMLWNEPNNLSHWNFETRSRLEHVMRKMVNLAAGRGEGGELRTCGACWAASRRSIRISFATCSASACSSHVDVVAVHGFPLDWNHWTIHEWPDKLDEIRAVTDLPLWVSEVGVSTFGAEEVQQFGLKRSGGAADRPRASAIHWYSLYDLPRAWPATTRHREAEGSSYYRHFYMGLLREDGTPKLALRDFAELHAGARDLPVVSFRRSPAG